MGMPATERGWTRAEVLDLIDRNPYASPRYELVDGELLVTPAPRGIHQAAIGRLLWLLATWLHGEPDVGKAFTSPADVILEPETTVGPDVFVVSTEQARRWIDGGPVTELLLAIEVLSPDDRSGDRTRKRALYQRRVPEYWIVDTEQRQIEIWHPRGDAPIVASTMLRWQPSGASTPFVLDVATFFAQLKPVTG